MCRTTLCALPSSFSERPKKTEPTSKIVLQVNEYKLKSATYALSHAFSTVYSYIVWSYRQIKERAGHLIESMQCSVFKSGSLFVCFKKRVNIYISVAAFMQYCSPSICAVDK